MSVLQPMASGTPPGSEHAQDSEPGAGYGRESVNNIMSTSPESISAMASSPPQKGLSAFLSVGTLGTLSDSQNSDNPLPVLPVGTGQAGGAGRVVAKTIDLVKWFNLPPQETLLDEFHCALRKRVLLQGRMYVFDHYVCFSSSVFGYVKRKVIPLSEMAAVRKKTHFRFPNSIELEYSQGRKEFFTSFLSRDDAYKLIMSTWSQVMANTTYVDPSRARALSSDTFEGGDAKSTPSRGRPTVAFDTPGPHALHRPSATSVNEEQEDDDEGGDEDEDTGMWVIEPRPAPHGQAGSKPVVHAVLPGTTKDFFETVLADNASFMEDFLDSQGNRRINVSSWKRHEQLGHVRDLQFTAPIKGAFGNWGVSHAACFQSHRFCLYSGSHIVFESSQTMTDIPYGDCFTVDLRWDVKEDTGADPDTPQVLFDIHIRVPFTRKCLFKSVIESGSFKQVQEQYSQLVEQLRATLTEKIAGRQAVNLRTPRGGVNLSDLARPSTMSRAATVGRMQSLPSMRQNGTLQRMPSVAGNTPGGMAVDTVMEENISLPGMGPQPASGTLSRVVSAVGGSLYNGVEWALDWLMNLCCSGLSRETRILFTVLLVMLCINVFMFATLLSRPATSAAAANAQLLAQLQAAQQAAAPPQLDAMYWQARLSVLQQELGLLQGRLETVSQEMTSVVVHLASAAMAGGGGSSAAADGAAAAAAAGGSGAAREL